MTGEDARSTSLLALATDDDAIAVAEACRLADRLAATDADDGTDDIRPEVVTVHFADQVDREAVASAGPDVVVTVERTTGAFRPGAADVAARVAALESVVADRRPRAVLTPSDPDGRDVAADLAQRLGVAVVTDALVHVRDGDLRPGRLAYEGRAFAEFELESDPAVVAVDRDAVGSHTPRDADPAFETRTVEVADDDRIEQRAVRHVPEDDLERTDRVVAGGYGLDGPDGFGMIEDLAEGLGAAVGASRPPADEGWVPYDRQIGVTGTAIDVTLYVPVAISGDPYHMRSVTANHLVAVNDDPEARIFEFADLGVVGDAYEVVPALVERLGTTATETAGGQTRGADR